MDQIVDLVALTRALIDIDSTTGREAAAGQWLIEYLRTLGLEVTAQPVDDSRFNVIAGPAHPTARPCRTFPRPTELV